MLPRLLLAGLLLAGLVWVGGCGSGSGSPGLPAVADSVLTGAEGIVAQTTVVPAELAHTGGEVEIRAGVQAPAGVSIAAVWASVQSDAETQRVSLGSRGAGTYAGSACLPANTDGTDRVYSVSVYGSDSAGRTYRAAAPLRVTVFSTIAQDGPPPAPPIPTITASQVAPNELGYDGGDVTLAVALSNRDNLGPVRAVVAGPEGEQELALEWDGGQYRGSLQVPANRGTAAIDYSVRIEVCATDGRLLLSETTTGLVVKGPSAPPPPPFP